MTGSAFTMLHNCHHCLCPHFITRGRNPLIPFGGHSPFPRPLASISPLSLSTGLPPLSTAYRQKHRIRVCDWVLSLSAMRSRFPTWQPVSEPQRSTVWRTHFLRLCSSSDGDPGCLHLWDVENRATMNTHVLVFGYHSMSRGMRVSVRLGKKALVLTDPVPRPLRLWIQ